MSTELSTTSGNKISWKALWNRPGGTFAKITAVAAAIGLGYGFVIALPFLMAAAAKTLWFIVELGAIAIILMIVTSKNFWKWISLFWLQLNRKIVGAFVKIDPISILQNGIRELRDKLNIVNDNVVKLEGVLVSMKKDQDDYIEELESNIHKRNATQKMLSEPNLTSEDGMKYKSNYILINNDIARLDKIIEAQKKRIETSEKYLQVMKKLKVVATFKVKDSESELKWRKQEYEQALKQQTAMKSIKDIMSGGLSKSLEEELALDYIATTVNDSIAEMNQLLDGSNDLLVNFDIESASNIDKVDAILSKYEQNGFESFNEKVETAPYQDVSKIEYHPENQIDITKMFKQSTKVGTQHKYF